MISEERSAEFVRSVLEEFARVKGVDPGARPDQIVTDSLDRMRFIVALEERADMLFDDLSVLDLNYQSIESLSEGIGALFKGARSE